MLQKIRKQNEGFTIIEVLIVLAIAGLILLIVFIAVPALQRNSRNTQRRNDIAAILGATTEYMNNSNGQFPSGAGAYAMAGKNAYVDYGGPGMVTVPMSYYDQGANGGISLSATSGAVTNSTNVDTIVIVRAAVCGTGASAGNAVSGSGRSFVALFTVEPNIKQCQAS